MSDGVIFLNANTKHLRNLAIAIFHMRKIYDGPIAILTGDSYLEDIFDLDDKRFGDVQLVHFDYNSRRNGCYAAKTGMHKLTPFDRTIFMDSDTLAVGDFSDLWPENPEAIHWTQFAKWTTQTHRIQQRIKNEGWPKLFPREVRYQLAHEYPAINTGVLGFTRGSYRTMDIWQEKTLQNISFICDEICAQLLAFEHPHNILDHRWNASPKFSYKLLGMDDMNTSDVRILHGHGNKGFKNDRPMQDLFVDAWFETWAADFAGIQKWDATVYKKKRHPSRYIGRFEARWRSWCKNTDNDPANPPPDFREKEK